MQVWTSAAVYTTKLCLAGCEVIDICMASAWPAQSTNSKAASPDLPSAAPPTHLRKGEQQRHVAGDALRLQPPARLNALPGAGDLDVHPAGVHPLGSIQLQQAQGLVIGGGGVIAEVGIHFGGHAPRDHLQHLAADEDGQHICHACAGGWMAGVGEGMHSVRLEVCRM